MGTMMINFYALCLQNIMNLRYQYADSDVLNVAVSGAKIRNLTSEITNLAHQLQKLNDVCTISHQHTQCIVEVFLAENCMENHIFWFIYHHCAWQPFSFEVSFATDSYHVSCAFQTGVIDMDNDWKLLTILIGGNDLCDR